MGGFRVFGFTRHCDVSLMTISFICIVAYLIIAEHVLSHLNELTKHSAYSEMIQSLYKDLTIMGVSSFILGMLLSSSKDLNGSKPVIYLVNIYLSLK